MNFIKICIFLIAVILAVCAEQQQVYDLNLVVKAILKDPEFVSLSVKRQFGILAEIYNILGENLHGKLILKINNLQMYTRYRRNVCKRND